MKCRNLPPIIQDILKSRRIIKFALADYLIVAGIEIYGRMFLMHNYIWINYFQILDNSVIGVSKHQGILRLVHMTG